MEDCFGKTILVQACTLEEIFLQAKKKVSRQSTKGCQGLANFLCVPKL